MNLQTFHPFPSLPPELRLKIWTLSLPRPRDLRYGALQYERNQSSGRDEERLRKPIALSVTSESRALALRYFSKPIDTRRDFVDFRYDYFYVENLPQRGQAKEVWIVPEDELEKIERVIIEFWDFEKCKEEFVGTVGWYAKEVLPSLKGVMLQFHVTERAMRPVAMEHLKSDDGVSAGRKSRLALQPMKNFAKEMLGKMGRGGVEGEVRDCGVCNMCVRLARCHAAQSAYRKKLRRRLEKEQRERAAEAGADGSAEGGVASSSGSGEVQGHGTT